MAWLPAVARRLVVHAAVIVGAGCLVGAAAGRPVTASLSEACNFGGLLPGKAALRACAGLNSPKETLVVEYSKSGVFTLHSPFAGVDIKTPVGAGYNHWNWGGNYLGDTTNVGCGGNDLTCKVDMSAVGVGGWSGLILLLTKKLLQKPAKVEPSGA